LFVYLSAIFTINCATRSHKTTIFATKQTQRRINRPSAMKTRSPSVTDLNRPSIRPRSHHRDPGAISRAQALRATPAPSRANYPHNGHINGAHRPSEFRIFSFPRVIINNVAVGINNVISISHAPQIDR
jgi:hypothetical protein